MEEVGQQECKWHIVVNGGLGADYLLLCLSGVDSSHRPFFPLPLGVSTHRFPSQKALSNNFRAKNVKEYCIHGLKQGHGLKVNGIKVYWLMGKHFGSSNLILCSNIL